MTTNEASRPSRRGPYAKSTERRHAILVAAHAVFAAHGYRAGSLQDVADHVGMSQTSLLHYFPSKSDLLLAVLNWRDSNTGDGATPPDPEETLVDAVIRQARFNEEIPGVIELYTVLCAESVTDGHPGREFFTERFERLRRSYARRFTQLAEEGRLRPGVEPEAAAASLIALWDGIQTQWLLAPANVDMAGCLRGYLELVILPE
ncbi:TetR/AcrR family transcriptional regulator [Pseudarthrobacter raffinosi]|uniref:TetR/AcrR family transcriptional regulator n=1 Tax=Pseudarthrobacter raffinosi TaxID=2953651 RepID=UPI00208F74DE|nr:MULTISPECIES: TetR/AcrR family transcriptional regulator [unclassified Pseudarthrobacter]MCO4250524.1 TetR/AcrR family transcriptional regulator [Pseudarthrobacter sp. MDT3-9]MCO4262662.1 TetR/AcrR family transcriptional regulator [Pseudarthrobacter sp. MDT3-26]